MTPLCPHCRQPLINTRLGVRLSPIKMRIFDAVERAGDGGVTRAALELLLYDHMVSDKTVKAHIWGINEMLAHTDVRIRSDRSGRAATYRLVNRN